MCIRDSEKFVCPGCVSGSNTTCGRYKPNDAYGHACENHVCGTRRGFQCSFALGMPTGFNMCARPPGEMQSSNKLAIRIWEEGTGPEWDNKNVPVWAQEIEGFLFVRALSPRIGALYVHIIEGGTLAQAPGALDVATFADEID